MDESEREKKFGFEVEEMWVGGGRNWDEMDEFERDKKSRLDVEEIWVGGGRNLGREEKCYLRERE